MTALRAQPAGATLVELLVVIAILGVVGTAATAALRPPLPPDAESPLARVNGARRRAIAARHPVTLHITDSGRLHQVRAFPDGRVVGAEWLNVDPISGRRRDAAR